MKTLLEAGVHFGHQTRRWDPRMRPFIFTERNGIHIIDLQQTVRRLDEAMTFVRQQAAEGKTMLFVGTKKQANSTRCQRKKPSASTTSSKNSSACWVAYARPIDCPTWSSWSTRTARASPSPRPTA